VLTWLPGAQVVCLRPHEIAVSNLEALNEALTVRVRMVSLVNKTSQ
jgi:hypothetical protein